MQKTMQDFLNGGIHAGTIDLWDNEKKEWRTAGQWKLVREARHSTGTGMPLVTFDFEYAPGYDGPAVSPDLPPPQGHSSVVVIKDGVSGKDGKLTDGAFDGEVPAILRQLTHGGNMQDAQQARLLGQWKVPGNDARKLPAMAGVERLILNGGVMLTGFRMTVEKGPLNYMPIIGAREITKEADDLLDAVQKGGIESKVNFFADEKRNMFAHTALGGATPKFLGCLGTNVLVVKPVRPEFHADIVVEHVMQEAQREAGINAAVTKLYKTSKKNTAMLSRHYGYDEGHLPEGEAFPFFAIRRTACSMAALTKIANNNDLDPKAASYKGMVAAINQYSSQAKKDREELAKRAIFHLMVNNTDNHYGQFEMMRNERNEWVLSPSYDVAPKPFGREFKFKTSFGGWESQGQIKRLSNEVLWERMAKDFVDEKGVPMPISQLKAMAVDVAKAVLNVPELMRKNGLSESVIKDYSENALWDKGQLEEFVKVNEGKAVQHDRSFGLNIR